MTNGHSFKPDELNRALLDIDDMMGRAMANYLVLGETAKNIKEEKQIQGDKIEVGLEERYLTREVKSLFNTYQGVEMTDKGFSYLFGEVPIEVKFITRRYKFFKNPDSKFYLAGEYRIPNPFENYWKSRFLVR